MRRPFRAVVSACALALGVASPVGTRRLAAQAPRLTSNVTAVRPGGWTDDSRHAVYVGPAGANFGPLRDIRSHQWDGAARRVRFCRARWSI